MNYRAGICLLVGLWVVVSGCSKPGGEGERVVLYTSVDEPVARPIIEEFERRTGLRVVVQTDAEANKSVGLATKLEAEKGNPQADVYWGNEIFRTIHLAEQGVLGSYESSAAGEIPAMYKDPKHRWAATALRVRVIARAAGTAEADGATRGVRGINDLTRPALKGRVCMGQPAVGTTAGHLAALYTVWGAERYEAFLRELKANGIRLVGGNSDVVTYVGGGEMWAGLTDNDDVEIAADKGMKVEMVSPDQEENGIGTLAIPCTVSLVANAPHSANGKKLVDYLLSKEVEGKLLGAKFARFSVFAPTGQGGVRTMGVDYAKVAGNLKAAVEMARRVLR